MKQEAAVGTGRRISAKIAVAIAFLVAVSFAPLTIASARTHYSRGSHHKSSHLRRRRRHRRRPRRPLYKAAILQDARTGKVLYQYNADRVRPPASMAKMMLLLVASEQVKSGRFKLDEPVRISERAAHTRGSRLRLRQGRIYPLGELMKAALIKSANDAAVAVAEKIAGSVEGMVRMMNQRARSLGMTRTVYHTVNGLPPRPGRDLDRTTARDLATVARALISHTDLLKWSRLRSTLFNRGVARLYNTNRLVGRFKGCDGLKTGFTSKAGFNLTATARRGNMRLVAVVMGARSSKRRFRAASQLLSRGFSRYTSVSLMKRGEPLPVSVKVSDGPVIRPVLERDLTLVLLKTEAKGLRLEYEVPQAVDGPIVSGDPLGRVVVHGGGKVLTRVAAVSPVSIELPAKPLVPGEGYPAAVPAAYYQFFPQVR